MTIKCGKCGQFLADAEAFTDRWGERIEDVRGDCSRCGPDVEAGKGWWWSWDAWKWPEYDRRYTDPRANAENPAAASSDPSTGHLT